MPGARSDDALTVMQLEDLAHHLAESHTIARHPERRFSILDRVREHERVLRDAYRCFATASDVQLALTYAAEWVLDNFYVVEQALRQIREDMPPGYYRQLPKLGSSLLEGYPRVYAIAQEVIAHSEHRLDLDRAARFIRAYQRVTPLTMGELWALPTMLRLGILEGLAHAVASVTGPLMGEGEPSSDTAVRSSRGSPEDEAIVASCILSLRTLATQDWKAFFESVSRVEQELRRDPAGVYARMDFDTRDRYRGVIEGLALSAGWDEEEVAREAIRLAEEVQSSLGEGTPIRQAHVGFYLLDAGRPQLEARLGYYPSWPARLSRWLLGRPTLVYLGGIALITLAVLLGLLAYAHHAGGTNVQLAGVGISALLPATAVALGLVNWLVTHNVSPRLLPRMDFQAGIPAECCTMLVVPALLSGTDEVRSLLRQLELHYLRNADPNLHLALLTDFADAPEKHMAGDDESLEQVRSAVRDLNDKYGRRGDRPFYLIHREREWNPAEECWMGWERKRGKLVEFNGLIGGRETSCHVQEGDRDVLSKIKYVITLDADTALPRGGARRLVAALAHPLNRAEFDPASGAVVVGYTVLQPRVEVGPVTASRSLFTRVFSGDTGLDLYTRAVSDVYQDLFGEGVYAGKGIYDAAAFERSLAGRVPENALLSHDLFEGIHGRVGLVTDVILYEDYPSHYLAYTRRLHRWVRGDWQLLPWLLPRVPRADGGRSPNDLPLFDRWKILDNLRRSLLTPALLALLIAGWLWLPGSPVVWTLAGMLALGMPVLIALLDVFRHRLGRASLGQALQSLRIGVLRWVLALVFLLYETLVTVDAIAATLVRLTITRRKLLQWTTAAHTVRLFGRETRLWLLWERMAAASLLALAFGLLVLMLNPTALVAAAPLLFAWMMSPYVAYLIGRPITRERASLSADQCQQLRRLARRTWLYFERFVGPDDQWLPPDHFQEEPLGIVAHSTSPTNLGLYLLSALAAHDFGYSGLLDLVLRLRPTFESMGKLERYEGHFLNWYDTRSLKPLSPRYVSAVDSGNLAACLLALKQGCQDLSRAPAFCWRRWEGLLDTLDVLAEIVARVKGQAQLRTVAGALGDYLEHVRRQILATRDRPDEWVPLLERLGVEGWREMERLLIELVESSLHALDAATLRDMRIWSERVSYQLVSIRAELDMLLPWLVLLSQPPTLFVQLDLDPLVADAWRALADRLPITPRLDEIPETCRVARAQVDRLQDLLVERLLAGDGSTHRVRLVEQAQEARDWCIHLAEELYSARMAAEGLLIGLHDLGDQAEAYFRDMDFGFLFDSYRQVFHIGYHVETETLDGNHYDLLASEARITSLLSIAKGDVPQSHWLHLSRPVTRVNGSRALLSWNGSMFEYLMPMLLMRHYRGTFLEQSCRAAVRRQIAYGRQKGVPWGISESGYYRFDAGMHYQYQGFGVPGLAFKRGLADDLVISPYASLLALLLFPREVMRNIARLVDLQMLGHYGFYEAVDYTRSRLPPDQRCGIICSYMVHHQGMILLSLTNYLRDEAMIGRFHADPRVRSVQLLLHEQVPHQAPIETPHSEEVRAIRGVQPYLSIAPWHVPVRSPLPQVHVLSNGRYSVLVTSAGGGYSRYVLSPAKGEREVDLTRWRTDTALDNWGTWVYVMDLEDEAQGAVSLWSIGCQPVASPAASRDVLFYAHKAEFACRDHDVSSRMEITVPPEANVEIRRVTLTNHEARARRLALTSYGEVVLAPHAADRRHQAFSKLFVESEYLPELSALLFCRRTSSTEETPVYLAHLLVVEGEREVVSTHESSRLRFLGRGGTPHSPAALSPPLSSPPQAGGRKGGTLQAGGTKGGTLQAGEAEEGTDEGVPAGATGPVLDPVMALGGEIVMKPHATTRAAYVTLVAESRQEALDLIRRYRSWPRIERAFDSARSRSELEWRRLNLSTAEVERIQQLLSVLLYPNEALRAAPATLAANRKGQPGLWGYGISGDSPILLVTLGDQEELDLLLELLQAHAYWRNRRIKVDLIVVNERETGYQQELQGQIHRLIARMGSDTWLNQRGGVFVLHAGQMDEADRVLLRTAACAVLEGKRGPLAEQLRRLRRRTPRLPHSVSTLPAPLLSLPLVERTEEGCPPLARPTDLLFDNGLGGFSSDGREYVIYLAPGQWTPAPWINVVAHPYLGFLVSEAGAGYTWAENSGENRLTPWRNDPVTETPGEALFLRDEETAQVWSPTPSPTPAPAPYLVRHGAGYSIFEHHSHGLKQQLCLFAVHDAPVKVVRLRLENTWPHIRRITATFYAEWVLGTTRDTTQQYIIPEFDAESNALLARNPYNEEFAERVAFLAASKTLHGLTADRTEFLGREGSLSHPAALNRIGLASTVRAGLDPCAALQVHLDLAPGEVQEIFFLLGQGADRQEAVALIGRYRDATQVEAAWKDVVEFWDDLLGTVSVRTPDPAMDLLLNRWLLYQTLSCRIWGRSALYQSSGAFGYRDQLQDVMAVLHAAPAVAREHVLRAARHQFKEGDVLHWWHPSPGPKCCRGVRTRCSDDLLWLPFVTAHYVATTGDEAILDEQVPFLRGDPLEEGELERYDHYALSSESATLYEHCLRTLKMGTTSGPHGLPLIGNSDWNDGLNRVGVKGKGESVWLGWFLYATQMRFAPLCERMGDAGQADGCRQQAQALRRALEENGWDGDWYRRAYYDDGTPLGSSESDEDQIDSLAQSWAVLSGAAGPARAVRAMEAVVRYLVRPDDRLILLFTPPFDKTERDPGYIKGYLPGIRENGGQYTHAALWVVWAFAELGQGDRVGELFRMLNPIYHGDAPERVARYRVEPYVVAADVYSVEPHVGRGGWTWYTGSAGWMYRLGLEAILGLRRVGEALQFNPCIPKHWPGYELTYRYGETSYHIRVENPDGVNLGVRQVTMDGEVLPGGEIPLLGDGRRHEVRVVMG